MTRHSSRCALIILDGWGIGTQDSTNAIDAAQTPFMDRLLAEQPHATLRTDGEHVGLPIGQMGNSEVGHMNIGAGRIVFQDLLRINRAVEAGTFAQEPVGSGGFCSRERKRMPPPFHGTGFTRGSALPTSASQCIV